MPRIPSRGYAMLLLLAISAFLSCIISPSAAFISPKWLTFENVPEPLELHVETDVFARADSSTNATSSVVIGKPVGEDGGLSWDQAVGKGSNLVKLLNTGNLSQCGIAQSNFTKWEALAQNGWGKLNQGLSDATAKNVTNWRPAAANLKLSTDGQKNTQYDLGQFENVTIGGTSYQNSGALYINVMNTDGAIFALQNFSPRVRGAHRSPSIDGSQGHELVPLQTWADVTFLEWANACKGDEKCIKGLKVITKCHTQSNATMRIGNQALGGGNSWGVWPGKSFTNGSDQFAALMATPSGRGVAWLLLTHRDQFGWKSVKSVKLWSDKDHDAGSNYYTFQLEDRTNSQDPPKRLSRSEQLDSELVVHTNLKRQSQSNESRIAYDTGSTSVNYADLYASDHDYNYDQAQKIGAYLANLTKSSAEQSCIQQSAWEFSDLASNGWTASTTQLKDTAALDALKTIFSNAKLSMDDEAPEHTVWEHDKAKTINGTAYPATHASYEALYSKHAIVLLEASSPISESQNKKKALLPPLKGLSDVLWLQWADWANANKADLKGLQLIEVYRATNPYTTRIIGQIFGGQTPPAYPGKSFGADSKELNAILASPHGQGVVWLLSQHKSDLGTKVVNRVQIWNDERPCILFEIAAFQSNVTQDATEDGPPNKQRAVRKSLSARAVSWDEAVAKGKRYLDMLRCGTGTPSRLTSYDDFETWGWSVTLEQPTFQYLGHKKQAVQYLGASYSAAETWTIGVAHDTQVTVKGTVYPPTNGQYQNDYNPEFIISLMNESPRAVAAEDMPPHEGPFPELERQSDLMFLEYQRKMEEMHKPMTGLKGMLRAGVINSESKNLVAKALGMTAFNGARLPAWPGRDFQADSDEAAALCASPNGVAAVWLLGTHKEQLGHKTISKVRVYGDYNTLSMLFVFEDVDDGSSDDDEEGGVSLPPQREKRSAIASGGNHLQKGVVRRSPQVPAVVVTGPGAELPQAVGSPQAPTAQDTEALWSKSVERGKQFLDMLNCGSGQQSEWTKYDDLAEWGWHPPIYSPILVLLDAQVNAMNYFKFSPLLQLTPITLVNNQASDHNGRHFNPTTASYANYYSSEIIIALSNWGPESGEIRGPRPDLSRLSDIWFLVYSDLMARQNKPLDGLKGIMRSQVGNDETKSLLFKATKTDPNGARRDLPTWPGLDFQADSDEFAALLASPNGRGVAWLLINHKQLGRKTFEKVRVWNDGGYWSMLFVFKDIDDEPGDQQEPSDPDSTPAVTGITQRSMPSAIAARALRPDQYQQLVDKGKQLVSHLQSTEDCFEQSQFTTYGALAEWGWSRIINDEGGPMKTTTAALVLEFVGASWKEEVNRKVTDKHNKRVVKDGVTYNPTGANYNNHYNPSLIIAKNNWGPASEGIKQPTRVTGGPNDPFPLLARLSDVWYLEFRRIMAENKQPMNELKGVWREAIMNQVTRELATQIASSNYMLHGIPRWPGKDFSPGSDEFAALVGCPNGVGVAYLLLQHREQMGRKTIRSVRVFYDMGVQIVYLIGDLGAQPGRALKERRSLVNSSAFGLEQYPTFAAHYLQPRALDDSTYATFTEKGKALVAALQASDTCVAQSEWTSDDALATWGWYRQRKPNKGPIPLFASTKQVYDFVGASTDDNMNHQATDIHDTKKEIDGITYFKTGASFDNRYNPSMIVAEVIYGAEHEGKTKNPPVTGDPNPSPKLKFWSDVSFLEFQKFMRDSGQPVNTLKAVWHRAIINPDTRDLAARLSAVNDWNNIPDWPGKDFKPGTDGFAALIGSDNGKGVAHLVLQHREQFGSKIITNARVWKDHTLHILYSIEDTCAGDSGGAPRVRSLARRADETDSQKLDDARAAGRFLVMAQDSSADILESCLNIPQSSFTEPHQLVDNGWTMTSHHAPNLDEDSDEATFNSWLDMNLDLAASSNQIIDYHHLQKTTGSDGTVYYPSGAYYQNLYTVRGIAAMDNASPWKTGRNMNPTVDGRQRPFPTLKQWSDAVFLTYKDFCGSDPVKMKKLKGCLQHNVVNTIAKQVLHEFMEKHGDLEDNRPKIWPGTEYNLGDDGFNVALGVPNGKGVAYLLATHRDALGWKEIYKTRIFSVGWASSYNILYYIRDHADSPSRRHLLDAPLNFGTNAPFTRDVAVRLADGDSRIDRNKAVGEYSHRPRADMPVSDLYTKSMEKGMMLICRLLGSVLLVEQSKYLNFEALAEYGWTTSGPSVANFEDGMIETLGALGLSTERSEYQHYNSRHDKATKHDGVDYPASDGQYSNAYNVDGGAIVAEGNMSPKYKGDPDHVIPLNQYSDVVFLIWQMLAGDRIKGLRYVFRHQIVNRETNAVLTEILETRGEQLKPWPGVQISMTEKDAWAILGTPNGFGVAWLLSQHKGQLGMKTIKAVTIYECWDENFCLCFWIEDLDHAGVDLQMPPDLQTPPVGGRSVPTAGARSVVSVDQHKKRSAVALPDDVASRHWARADEDPSEFYEMNLERGVMLQCRLANDAGSEAPSQWPNYGSLAYYGWETPGGRQYRPEAGMAAVLHDLGLSVEPTANLRHQYKHNHETQHEGHTYPASGGDYTNIFHVDGGAIIGDMNQGPDHVMYEKDIEGEVVPLKQYSDVVFLAWQHEAGARTNGLRYIIKKGIVNDETILVAQHILQQRNVQLQPWPGLKIPLPHQDALALMGSPSGRGAAWMLIQHKTQLGMKRFSHVTLFADNHALSVCFWIQDVHDGDMDLDLPQGLPGQSHGDPAKRSAVVPVIDTLPPSPSGLGERLIGAISKRTGDVVKNFWGRLRLF